MGREFASRTGALVERLTLVLPIEGPLNGGPVQPLASECESRCFEQARDSAIKRYVSRIGDRRSDILVSGECENRTDRDLDHVKVERGPTRSRLLKVMPDVLADRDIPARRDVFERGKSERCNDSLRRDTEKLAASPHPMIAERIMKLCFHEARVSDRRAA